MAHLFTDQGGTSHSRVIPLVDLRNAARNAQPGQGTLDEGYAGGESRPGSRLHDLIVTDNGIAAIATARKRTVRA